MWCNFEKIKKFVLDVLFPPACLNCDQNISEQKHWLCENCKRSILYYNTFFCPICRKRLPEFQKRCHPEAGFVAAALMSYESPATKTLIRFFKYEGFESLGTFLGSKMASFFAFIRQECFAKDKTIIIPMPLDFLREKRRGFNQAKILAREVAEKSGLPLVLNALERIRSESPQSKLKAKERLANVSGRFRPGKNAGAFYGKIVVLIDDVFTTGATAGEAVKTLKSSGAKSVFVFCLCRR